MSDDRFPLTYEGVTLRIERLREEAGRDAQKLAALSAELDRELRENAPDWPERASYARGVLENYQLLADHGFFPEPHVEGEDL